MRLKFLKSAPTLIAAAVILLVCLLEILRVDFLQQLEWKTYDLRVKQARLFSVTNAPNLGFLQITDQSITAVNDGSLGFYYGLYWPRQIYGRILQELSEQKSGAVAFDVVFAELRPDHASIQMPDGSVQESDEFFGNQIKHASNVILAASPPAVFPARMFRTNCWAMGNIKVEKDSDGILRRDKAFVREWHPIIKKMAIDYGFDLENAKIESDKLTFFQGTNAVAFPRNKDGTLNFKDFGGDPPPGVPAQFPPQTNIWSMGIVLAANRLKLDLDHPVILPGKIVLHGARGVERSIPIDADNDFYIEWSVRSGDRELTEGAVEELLHNQILRTENKPVNRPSQWHDKLIVVGSTATGNDLSDRGATPIENDTVLASKHWNVANSILTGRFVTRSSLGLDLLLIFLVGIASAWITWTLKPLTGFLSMLLLATVYAGLALFLYVQYRFWLPFILPMGCAGFMTYTITATYRVRFEQTEKKRIRNVFSKIVAPTVVNELLEAEKISTLKGKRQHITIYFADVRGFTELTDVTQARAEEYIRQNNLSGVEAEAYNDKQAKETLDTVSLYLKGIADTVIEHNGTLDKYIGDCVMAFWGAPLPNPHHARDCVHAAIASQRALHLINQQRQAENNRRTAENVNRVKLGLAPEPMQPLLSMGSGINTGTAVVGLMGSEEHISNYTVFGREVNLAARLESVSGYGRIIIGEATHRELLRDDPELAARCKELEPVSVKGFRQKVRIFEVPWNDDAHNGQEVKAPAKTIVAGA